MLAAAAKNLTPVTLELGGKSPIVVARGARIAETAKRPTLALPGLPQGGECSSATLRRRARELGAALQHFVSPACNDKETSAFDRAEGTSGRCEECSELASC